MRKILFGVFGCLVAVCAHAAQIVNVDYVHKLIAQKWDISVPIKTNNIMAAVNMKYLLTAVDVANEILNGEKTTDYGNGEFATLQAAVMIHLRQQSGDSGTRVDKISHLAVCIEKHQVFHIDYTPLLILELFQQKTFEVLRKKNRSFFFSEDIIHSILIFVNARLIKKMLISCGFMLVCCKKRREGILCFFTQL